ncbi:MAG TPA: hypothetical protein VGM77_14135 [Gemmatimonadales bacterium]
MSDRAGRGGPGCVGTLAIIAIIIFLVAGFFPPWLHYAQFRDQMRSEARYGVTLADSVISQRLMTLADTLGLPPEAKKLTIRRHGGRPPTITISSEYTERVNVPFFGVKLLHFKPTAEESM